MAVNDLLLQSCRVPEFLWQCFEDVARILHIGWVGLGEMLNASQMVTQLRPHWQFLQELLQCQNTKAKHFCMHRSPQSFQDAAQSEPKVCGIDQIVVDERPKKFSRGCQLLWWVLRKEPALVEEVLDHSAVDLMLPTSLWLCCKFLHDLNELRYRHLARVNLAEVSVGRLLQILWAELLWRRRGRRRCCRWRWTRCRWSLRWWRCWSQRGILMVCKLCQLSHLASRLWRQRI
mmetsp:Transcript_15436/g.28387  ORF Transcript_15436/g.28387 Transcript_15436/m.28387 type:complete len:232 (-) Transcript_15436:33-728(-)